MPDQPTTATPRLVLVVIADARDVEAVLTAARAYLDHADRPAGDSAEAPIRPHEPGA